MNNLIDPLRGALLLLQKRGFRSVLWLAAAAVLAVYSTDCQGAALAQEGIKMYWTDAGNDTIKRADLDGSDVETLVGSDVLSAPYGIAIASFGKVYWTDAGNDTIKRADLDGSGVETLVSSGMDSAYGLAIDGANKMYWTDNGNDTIKRADLDGSDVETLVSSGLSDPRGIAIDGDKMYWADAGNDTIKRADLDGSDVETLVSSGLSIPRGIAIDGDKMYWADSGNDTIKRADLDGSDVETLVSSGLDDPQGIATDGAKMYWTDAGTDTIKRADLDGSNVETLVSMADGLHSTQSIAVASNVPVSFAPDGEFAKDRVRGWQVTTQKNPLTGMTSVNLRWDLLADADGYEVLVLDNGVREAIYRISHEAFAVADQEYRLARLPGDRLRPEDPNSEVLRYLTVQVRAYQVNDEDNHVYSEPTESLHVSFLEYGYAGPDGDTLVDPPSDPSGIVGVVQEVVDTTGMELDAGVLIVPFWFMLSAGFAAFAGWAASGGGWSSGGLVVAGLVFMALWVVVGPALVGIPIVMAIAPAMVLALAGALVLRRSYS